MGAFSMGCAASSERAPEAKIVKIEGTISGWYLHDLTLTNSDGKKQKHEAMTTYSTTKSPQKAEPEDGGTPKDPIVFELADREFLTLVRWHKTKPHAGTGIEFETTFDPPEAGEGRKLQLLGDEWKTDDKLYNASASAGHQITTINRNVPYAKRRGSNAEHITWKITEAKIPAAFDLPAVIEEPDVPTS